MSILETKKEAIRIFAGAKGLEPYFMSEADTRLIMQALFDHSSDEAAELHDQLATNMDLSRFENAGKPVVILFVED